MNMSEYISYINIYIFIYVYIYFYIFLYDTKKIHFFIRKELLLECMVEYKNIIENKKADDNSIKAKYIEPLRLFCIQHEFLHVLLLIIQI